eukprot:CAMPEP_0115070628 /NCGR_PEP_ID=MMETSP0227-20121206/13223_1 /TAXON_ID=89957 /ORGANISM="Polarella glacialis, Strain CCMP 1383" /LENGTH=236 /DNA_ID=CAMNT_0002457171 /DNA_START=95 /DNA_END=805 /DNA_ORIENTATION=+
MGQSAAFCQCADGLEEMLEVDQIKLIVADNSVRDVLKEQNKKQVAQLAKALRARAIKDKAEAWKKVGTEFAVQKMIWESMSLQRGKSYQGEIAMMESKLMFATRSYEAQPDDAVEALKTCIEKNTKGAELLGGGLSQSMQAVFRSIERAGPRQELASLLERALEISSAAVQPAASKLASWEELSDELNKLLAGSHLQDPRMEFALRTSWKGMTSAAAAEGVLVAQDASGEKPTVGS